MFTLRFSQQTDALRQAFGNSAFQSYPSNHITTFAFSFLSLTPPWTFRFAFGASYPLELSTYVQRYRSTTRYILFHQPTWYIRTSRSGQDLDYRRSLSQEALVVFDSTGNSLTRSFWVSFSTTHMSHAAFRVTWVDRIISFVISVKAYQNATAISYLCIGPFATLTGELSDTYCNLMNNTYTAYTLRRLVGRLWERSWTYYVKHE